MPSETSIHQTSTTVVQLRSLLARCTFTLQANSSSAAESTADEEEATPLLEAKALQPGEALSMEAMQKPERKLKETRTFNPRKMRPKR